MCFAEKSCTLNYTIGSGIVDTSFSLLTCATLIRFCMMIIDYNFNQ